jgi:uncharacterized secreted protein with C-terminal beta-propeller domain
MHIGISKRAKLCSVVAFLLAVTLFSVRTQSIDLEFSVNLQTDLNGDGVVNIVDVSFAALAFGSRIGDVRWNAKVDIDANGVIDIVDVGRVAGDFGKKIDRTSAALATFSSYEELHEYLKENSQPQGWYPYTDSSGNVVIFISPGLRALPPEAVTSGADFSNFAASYSKVQHSETNIQVSNVDEADVVKVDDYGYIYMITGNNITIMKAYPAGEAEIVSILTFADMTPVGIFVNGDRLAVLGTQYSMVQSPYLDTAVRMNYFTDVSTYAKIYDISNRSQPELMKYYNVSGSYFNSRMIGDYVYFVSSTPAFYTLEILPNITVDKVNLPKIDSNGNSREVSATEVHYSNTTNNDTDSYYNCNLFTTIAAMNIQNVTEELSYKTIMTGGASSIYVSLHNIYIAYPSADKTAIYRIHIENNKIMPEAQGDVLGQVLNQFSMDEYEDHFRIATTSWGMTTSNNVYVLNMSMAMVGKLENLAPDEHIYSSRFMGNKAYLVTFVSIDPLFVIDLSDPRNPSVLGELKIPGYSDYLHPYDENHLIGIGKHTTEADEGFFAWYQGVKIAMFDVSDVSNPLEIANYTIGDRGSDSPVLRDHKAFLFDREKNLLVIPALVAQIDRSEYPGEVPPWAYGKPVWQGALVFNVTLQEGFGFRGGITHIENINDIDGWNYYVQRSLYIEDVLYTISNVKVKMNSLHDLTFINEIELDSPSVPVIRTP